MNSTYFSGVSERPALVIGAAGLDIIGRMKSSIEYETSNPAHINTTFGGVARNVAENLARLGQKVHLISVVGEDYTGDQLLNNLTEAGVGISAVLRTSEVSTGTYIGVLDDTGGLLYAMDDMQAIDTLHSDHLKENLKLFKDASLLFIDANLPLKTLRTALSLARKAHIPVFADPTSNRLAKRLQPYLERIFLITPNTQEAAIYLGREFDPSNQEQTFEAAKNLVSQGVGIALITLAELGVCYVTSETSGYIPSVKTEVIDPTGAGDALTATLIFALLNDIRLDDAIRLGVSAASLTLRYPGAVVPDLSLEKLYDHW